MDKERLLKDLENEFEEMKKNLGFGVTLDELDSFFFIRDAILKDGFVSNDLNRQISARISDTFMSWNNYLHGLVFTAPGNMMFMTESRVFSDEEKKEMSSLISSTMGIVSMNTLVGVSKDNKMQAEFFDKAYEFWKNEFGPKITEIIGKVHKSCRRKISYIN